MFFHSQNWPLQQKRLWKKLLTLSRLTWRVQCPVLPQTAILSTLSSMSLQTDQECKLQLRVGSKIASEWMLTWLSYELVKLLTHAFNNTSQPSFLIWDPFLTSCSTAWTPTPFQLIIKLRLTNLPRQKQIQQTLSLFLKAAPPLPPTQLSIHALRTSWVWLPKFLKKSFLHKINSTLLSQLAQNVNCADCTSGGGFAGGFAGPYTVAMNTYDVSGSFATSQGNMLLMGNTTPNDLYVCTGPI